MSPLMEIEQLLVYHFVACLLWTGKNHKLSPGICYSWVMVMPVFCEITRIEDCMGGGEEKWLLITNASCFSMPLLLQLSGIHQFWFKRVSKVVMSRRSTAE